MSDTSQAWGGKILVCVANRGKSWGGNLPPACPGCSPNGMIGGLREYVGEEVRYKGMKSNKCDYASSESALWSMSEIREIRNRVINVWNSWIKRCQMTVQSSSLPIFQYRSQETVIFPAWPICIYGKCVFVVELCPVWYEIRVRGKCVSVWQLNSSVFFNVIFILLYFCISSVNPYSPLPKALVAERDGTLWRPLSAWQKRSLPRLGKRIWLLAIPVFPACISPVFVTVFLSFDIQLHLSCHLIHWCRSGGGFPFIVMEPRFTRHFIPGLPSCCQTHIHLPFHQALKFSFHQTQVYLTIPSDNRSRKGIPG